MNQIVVECVVPGSRCVLTRVRCQDWGEASRVLRRIMMQRKWRRVWEKAGRACEAYAEALEDLV